MKFEISIKHYGSHALLIEWPGVISDEILDDVLRLNQLILGYFKDKAGICTTPSYHSLLVQFIDSETIQSDVIVKELHELYTFGCLANRKPAKKIFIPVCYDESLAPDLYELSTKKGLTPEKFIWLHTTPLYRVFCVGFLPGFIYLGGLDPLLCHPRKDIPRQKVIRGSVGIAGSQTGIYPGDSPGGWNIIGNTPLQLFKKQKNNPSLAEAGDYVALYPISKEEHEQIRQLIEMGEYEPKIVTHDG